MRHASPTLFLFCVKDCLAHPVLQGLQKIVCSQFCSLFVTAFAKAASNHQTPLLRHMSDTAFAQVPTAVEGASIEDVVKEMAQHMASPATQEHGCTALRGFAADAEVKTKVANAGGIHAILDAMKQHDGAAGVQEQGIAALQALTVSDDLKVGPAVVRVVGGQACRCCMWGRNPKGCH